MLVSRMTVAKRGAAVDDTEALTKLNLQFIEAFRRGSWELLEPILSPSFSYLDGATGEVWSHERYVETSGRTRRQRSRSTSSRCTSTATPQLSRLEPPGSPAGTAATSTPTRGGSRAGSVSTRASGRCNRPSEYRTRVPRIWTTRGRTASRPGLIRVGIGHSRTCCRLVGPFRVASLRACIVGLVRRLNRQPNTLICRDFSRPTTRTRDLRRDRPTSSDSD
jgi:hypothetical protein